MQDITIRQKTFCAEHQSPFDPLDPKSTLGFALSTEGKRPINGLRHRPVNNTNGWYVWCREDSSASAEFFSPLCVEHIYKNHPELIGALRLAPGFRFVIAGDYVDVWYNESLLTY